MTARVLDGTKLADEIRAEVAEAVAKHKSSGRQPGLAVVIVGENPASQVYVRAKGKACEEAGMHSETIRLPDTATEAELLATVDRLNRDPSIHGFLVQLPLPKHINAEGRGRLSPGQRRQSFYRRSHGAAARYAIWGAGNADSLRD
jgi:methylenetetrahydrofolate dehydrogenase (NADP+)/methenyltetrahydrofolate cyclohydrolase